MTVAAYGKVKIQIEFVSGVKNQAFVTGPKAKLSAYDVSVKRASTVLGKQAHQTD